MDSRDGRITKNDHVKSTPGGKETLRNFIDLSPSEKSDPLNGENGRRHTRLIKTYGTYAQVVR